MKLNPCLVCGCEDISVCGTTRDGELAYLVHCPRCDYLGVPCAVCEDAEIKYENFRAAIVSRVLAEAVKDAPRVEATTAWNGDTGVCQLFPKKKLTPGTYALVPVKEAKP